MYGTDYWKGTFINDLVKDLNFNSYLELGVAGAETWNSIFCDTKIGVDNNPEIQNPDVVCKTTDEYFESLDPSVKFDVIYIDAYHEKNQVKRDFFNSWNHLNPGGVIVMHDINPPTPEGTFQTAHGDCFAFWIDLVKTYGSNLASFSGGTIMGQYDSVGLYFKNDESVNPEDISDMDYDYEYFDSNRETYIAGTELTYENIIARFS
jgi:hypothetical protein